MLLQVVARGISVVAIGGPSGASSSDFEAACSVVAGLRERGCFRGRNDVNRSDQTRGCAVLGSHELRMGVDESLCAIVSDDAKLYDLRLAALEDPIELTAEHVPVVGMDVSDKRVETMVAMAGLDMPQRSVRTQIASAIEVVIQLSRLSDGRRKLVSLQEITGMEGEIITMQEIFSFDRRGVDADGNVLGEILPTGVRPKFSEKLKLSGFTLAANLFDPHPG